ncbi:MAG: hypothetical protein IVW57_03830 [Ktedonobacterales bacterium]|nr:hypothetical protein [Ktedonobacterales bacterium]
MSSLVERAIREPEVQSARQYTQRIHRLAAAYTGLFFLSLVGIALLIWQAQLYVTLSQRSNVETLTLAFFLLFFAYLAALSLGGTIGAARIAWYALLARLGPDRAAVEQRKLRALRLATSADTPAAAALNRVLDLETQPRCAFTLPVEDAVGSMGQILVDGAEITHRQTVKGGSSAVLAYFAAQVNAILAARGALGDGALGDDALADVQIVEWRNIDDEETEEYLSMVRFARNLERHLGTEALWPTYTLTTEECAELTARLRAICPALRNEAFLPHWEYQGEHKIPLIPEPLGLISLSRTEKRVDPLASMGCAMAVVAVVVAILVLLIIWPPWVPGK